LTLPVASTTDITGRSHLSAFQQPPFSAPFFRLSQMRKMSMLLPARIRCLQVSRFSHASTIAPVLEVIAAAGYLVLVCTWLHTTASTCLGNLRELTIMPVTTTVGS